MSPFETAALAAGWIVNPAWKSTNPIYVNAPYSEYINTPHSCKVLFAVPQFSKVQPRKRRLAFKRRYVKRKLKEYLTPPPTIVYCAQDYEAQD